MANIESWRQSAAACRYPFGDDCALVDRTGRYVLPDDLFVDARLNASAGAGDAWLASVAQAGAGISGVIRLDDQVFGTFGAAPGERTAPVVDADGVARGLLVLGRDFSLPAAALTFAKKSAVFSAGCVFRYPAAVLRSVAVTDPAGLAAVLSGRIALVEGTGMQILKIDGATLRIDALGAADDDLALDCFGPLGDPVGSINGQPLSAAGDYRIEPDQFAEPVDPDAPRQILRVQAGTNALTIGLARPA